ncbi:Anhydro-N-acetylmuramic acid kinase [Chromobacterium violaceum]|uniref:Anhydro-N-acetylmuramic acid kinase n=1 Tax=Chromobacterium violaceum TaxID=536 RepID=A0A447TE12_CHRVL|nr:Anhydro-N-acetylmuramic acid kinase [Chromobacterium violaceum]
MTDLYIGMMSGTSLDGVDAVLVRFDDAGRPAPLADHVVPYPDAVKQAVLALQPAAMTSCTARKPWPTGWRRFTPRPRASCCRSPAAARRTSAPSPAMARPCAMRRTTATRSRSAIWPSWPSWPVST